MMIFNDTRKLLLRQLFNSKSNKFLFASRNDKDNKSDDLNEQSLGNYRGIIYNMRKDANVARKDRQQNKQLYKHTKRVQDHLVELTLYMQHNNWKSQFIYLLLNYNKLGFKIVSDYAFLDSSSYMLELRNIKEEDRWPTVRVIIGLRPRIIVTGAEEIQKFFVENMYFQQTLLKGSPETEFAKKYIDEQIVPHMESLMWHPTLTYQTTFHTDTFYHQAEQKNYMLVEILWRNFGKCGKTVFTNMLKIMKEKQRYLNSKEKLTKSLKQMSELYLTKGQFFGGSNPNFIDFYLFSHLKTNWQSRYFKAYLQDEISQQFKRWLVRMGWNCEYSRDRVTVL